MEFAGLLERAMAVSFAISEVCTLVWAHAEVHSYLCPFCPYPGLSALNFFDYLGVAPARVR